MNDKNRSTETQSSTNETKRVVPHAPWQLEKDTEGLDNPPKGASESSKKTSSSSKEKEEGSEDCGCKYF